MARRRKTKRKKNPTTAQWVVLGVGGAVGLGLIGYGIHLAVKGRKALPTPPEGLGVGVPVWTYEVSRTRQPGPIAFTAKVFKPDGTIAVYLQGFQTPAQAVGAAKAYIIGQGGVAVERTPGRTSVEA